MSALCVLWECIGQSFWVKTDLTFDRLLKRNGRIGLKRLGCEQCLACFKKVASRLFCAVAAVKDIEEFGGVSKSMLTLNEAIIDVKEG